MRREHTKHVSGTSRVQFTPAMVNTRQMNLRCLCQLLPPVSGASVDQEVYSHCLDHFSYVTGEASHARIVHADPVQLGGLLKTQGLVSGHQLDGSEGQSRLLMIKC